jgi:hypothetical protein
MRERPDDKSRREKSDIDRVTEMAQDPSRTPEERKEAMREFAERLPKREGPDEAE